MSRNMLNGNAGIVGIGICIPEQVLTNQELAERLETSEEWIETRTGIRERRIASSHQAASDLGSVAAEQALGNAGILPEEVDLIIVATATPDMQFPSTACLIQEKLGLKNAAAFDLTAGCSGFIYALTVGNQFIATGFYRTILVIGTEVLSRVTDWEDRETCILLGDGAGAVVLRQAPPGYGILSMYLGADGSGSKYICMPAGGSRMPITQQAIADKLHKFKMDGQEVSKFAIKILPKATEEALGLAKVKKEEITMVIPHQANMRIIEAAGRRLEIPIEKFMINVNKYGNTSSASIPIALYEALQEGRINQGDTIVLTGFGVGLTWGSIVMRW